jgi:hypothetical protein
MSVEKQWREALRWFNQAMDDFDAARVLGMVLALSKSYTPIQMHWVLNVGVTSLPF